MERIISEEIHAEMQMKPLTEPYENGRECI